jgi:hypothetical protein
VKLSIVRVTAALLPTAALLHECAYLFAAEPVPSVHGYIGTAVPWVVALTASLVAAALLLPLLRSRFPASSAGADRRAPFALAAALIGIFLVQELAEGLLLGGGAEALAGALAAAWVVLPLALGAGLLAAAAIESMERGAVAVAGLLEPRVSRDRPNAHAFVPRSATPAVLSHAPLAFGLARRPPPGARARA